MKLVLPEQNQEAIRSRSVHQSTNRVLVLCTHTQWIYCRILIDGLDDTFVCSSAIAYELMTGFDALYISILDTVKCVRYCVLSRSKTPGKIIRSSEKPATSSRCNDRTQTELSVGEEMTS